MKSICSFSWINSFELTVVQLENFRPVPVCVLFSPISQYTFMAFFAAWLALCVLISFRIEDFPTLRALEWFLFNLDNPRSEEYDCVFSSAVYLCCSSLVWSLCLELWSFRLFVLDSLLKSIYLVWYLMWFLLFFTLHWLSYDSSANLSHIYFRLYLLSVVLSSFMLIFVLFSIQHGIFCCTKKKRSLVRNKLSLLTNNWINNRSPRVHSAWVS